MAMEAPVIATIDMRKIEDEGRSTGAAATAASAAEAAVTAANNGSRGIASI